MCWQRAPEAPRGDRVAFVLGPRVTNSIDPYFDDDFPRAVAIAGSYSRRKR
jgi:hypothetical protein